MRMDTNMNMSMNMDICMNKYEYYMGIYVIYFRDGRSRFVSRLGVSFWS